MVSTRGHTIFFTIGEIRCRKLSTPCWFLQLGWFHFALPLALFPRPTPLKTGMKAWLKVFRKPFFEQFGDDMENVLQEVEDLLRPCLCDARGNWTADYVRLRVEAVKPA